MQVGRMSPTPRRHVCEPRPLALRRPELACLAYVIPQGIGRTYTDHLRTVQLIFNYTVPLMLSPQQAGWGIKIGMCLGLVSGTASDIYPVAGLFFGSLTILGLVIIYFTVPEVSKTPHQVPEPFH